ncbi:MAG TPA: type II secretion system F family protein [Hellea balneolensis]|uniref:Type II secretion system F family protein n=1 Tax=Hellea balneolensis TaxID=287478 RepID=A0A7C5QV65_9PROT|nr:type II secretion system F family protein [Hellea balneolensis]
MTLTPSATLALVILFLAMSFGAIAILAFVNLRQARITSRRLAGMPGSVSGRAPTKKIKPAKNLVALIGKHLTLPDAKEISKIRFSLSQAGFYSAKSVPVFYAVRLAAILVPQFILLGSAAFIGSDFSPNLLLKISILLIVVGMFAPGYFIRSRTNNRMLSAREGFPDFLDLLLSCIEAGLGLDAALNTVAKELGQRYPVLKINLDLLNLELMAGRRRHEAFKNFAERLGLEEARALTVMLKQSEEMGSSLGNALRTFSDELRSKRMLLAEEKAMALSAKLTVPLILFIFPTLMAMLLLPAAARLSVTFGG